MANLLVRHRLARLRIEVVRYRRHVVVLHRRDYPSHEPLLFTLAVCGQIDNERDQQHRDDEPRSAFRNRNSAAAAADRSAYGSRWGQTRAHATSPCTCDESSNATNRRLGFHSSAKRTLQSLSNSATSAPEASSAIRAADGICADAIVSLFPTTRRANVNGSRVHSVRTPYSASRRYFVTSNCSSPTAPKMGSVRVLSAVKKT